jgi:lactoylglutathione lyase
VIEGVNQAMLEVEDQDRALAFWTERIEFEVVQDAPYGEDGRWLEVRTRDKAVTLVLSLRRGERPTAPEERPTSNVLFYCADLPRTYEELHSHGRPVPAAAGRAELGLVVDVRDQEGNRFALGQRQAS